MRNASQVAALVVVFLVLGAVGVVGQPTTNTLPTVSVTPGPDWASQLNAAISELQQIIAQKLGNASLNITDADVKHGARTVRYGPNLAAATAGTPALSSVGDAWTAAAGTDRIVWSLPFADNDRITAISVYAEVAVATAWSAELQQWNALTGGFSSIATATSTTAAGITKLSLSMSPTAVVSPLYYQIRWSALGAGNKLRAAEVIFDKITTP